MHPIDRLKDAAFFAVVALAAFGLFGTNAAILAITFGVVFSLVAASGSL